MKKPVIHMCGASDLEDMVYPFKEVVEEMNCIPTHFFDASLRHSNLEDWPTNSIKNIKEADIIVYIIAKRYGAITWETEFGAALLERKQFVILCKKKIYDTYQTIKSDGSKLDGNDSDLAKLLSLLEELERQNRTVAPFDNNFRQALKDEITQIFFNGLELLNSSNSKSNKFFEAVKNRDTTFLERYKPRDFEIEEIKKKLSNPFENKEFRKRIFDYLTDGNFYLQDKEILALLDDSEQGIRRKVYDELPSILTTKSNLDAIFDHIASQATQPSRDVAIENRAIPNMIKIDIGKAVLHLDKLFPYRSINAPKKILIEIDENFEKVIPNLADNAFYRCFCTLVKNCRDYDKTSESMLQRACSIESKLEERGFAKC